jgi:hypothetical protein
MGKTVLTLDTIDPDRDCIEIDGKKYELRNEEELSIKESARLRKLGQYASIGKDATEEQLLEIESSVDAIIRIIVADIPQDVLDKLNWKHKFSILSAFMTVASSRRAGAMAGGNGSLQTTEGSSQGSGGSTVELSKAG